MNNYKSFLISFGSRLRSERERQNLTRLALAERANTKQDFIAQLERGDKSPSMQTLFNILQALNVGADSLFFGVTNEESNEMENIVNDFTGFLRRRSPEDVSALYEIVKLISKYPAMIGKTNT